MAGGMIRFDSNIRSKIEAPPKLPLSVIGSIQNVSSGRREFFVLKEP